MSAEPIRKVRLRDGSTRYRVVVDVGRKPDGSRAQRTATFQRRWEAREWLTETRRTVSTGTYVAPTRVTLGQHLDAWLAGRRGLRPGTVRGYADALLPVRDLIGGLPLQQVTRADVERVVGAMLAGTVRRIGTKGAPLSPRSCNLTLTVLKAAFESAVRDGLLTRNPAAYVEHVPQRRTEPTTWTAEQVRTFLAVAGADRHAAAWRLSLLGLRRSEVLGLTWDALDLDAGTLTVRQGRTSSAGVEHVGAPKSARSRRTLPLDAGTVAALRAVKARQAAERLAAGPAYEGAGGYVVIDELGRPPRPDAYSDRFRALARAAGVPAIRLHDARHSCLTLLHLAGVAPAVISAWAGHHSAAFTMSVYVHSQDAALAAAGDVLGGLLGDGGPATRESSVRADGLDAAAALADSAAQAADLR